MNRRAIDAICLLFALILGGVLAWIWTHAEVFAQGASSDLLSGFVAGLIAALVAVGIGWVAWTQLGDVANTASADFILRLKQDFFQDRIRTIITLVANRWLQFVEFDDEGNPMAIPYLAVRQGALDAARLPDEVKARLRTPGVYTAFDIDDLLLGPLVDVAVLWEAGTLRLDTVRSTFGWYVRIAWDDPDVSAYIVHQRTHEGEDVYAALGRLRQRC